MPWLGATQICGSVPDCCDFHYFWMIESREALMLVKTQTALLISILYEVIILS